MKKLILSLVIASAASLSYGQGTVTFDNRTSTLGTPPDRLVRWDSILSADPSVNPYGGTNNAVVTFGTHSYVAQLYFGSSTAAEGSLVAVTTAPAAFRLSTSANFGTWAPGGRTLTAFPAGSTVNLQVRVWDLSASTDYFLAVAGGGITGKSAIFTYTIPTDPTAPTSAFNIANFSTFTLSQIPEPTTLALAGLGATALLIFRRRK